MSSESREHPETFQQVTGGPWLLRFTVHDALSETPKAGTLGV